MTSEPRGFSFEVLHRDTSSGARLGVLRTRQGDIPTPVFMPVGTAGSVKALPHEWLERLGARLILANTYHLYLRPGPERIERLGGLHRFMSWCGGILTDSGGFQVYSHRKLRRIQEDGVDFQSHLDGSSHFLTPEKVMEIQHALGSDIVMSFDECTPYPCSRADAEESMRLSMRWASRCAVRWREVNQDPMRAHFGIVQGSVFADLRRESVELLREIPLSGLAIGGLSVGEPKDLMFEILEQTLPLLPADGPRYLMGIGTPRDLVRSVALGADMFDCVLPTRNARNGCLFTSRGRVLIKNVCHAEDESPPDPECHCPTCGRYSRAYLRHLFVSGEYLSAILNTVHNLSFYLDTMRKIRQAIASNSFGRWLERLDKYPE